IIYSSMEAVEMAISIPRKHVIFGAIGFETTAPSTAVAIREAQKRRLKNFKVLSAHKVMPPAMKAIIREGVKLNGYICPGHVSTVTGSKIYDIFPEKFNVATVISGFEPADILLSILMLIRQVNSGKYKTEIQYRRAVKTSGNPVALKLMRDVFEETNAIWRGLGELPDSGLRIKKKYRKIDAMRFFSLKPSIEIENPACICGEILKGTKEPVDCCLFGKACTPEKPVGACMVSPEGSCNAWIRWRVREETS
ncbi:MAG: hydrogenase formation protein HypD, partial [bacterium]